MWVAKGANRDVRVVQEEEAAVVVWLGSRSIQGGMGGVGAAGVVAVAAAAAGTLVVLVVAGVVVAVRRQPPSSRAGAEAEGLAD